MCTYHLTLDDQLVAEAENALRGVSLQAWLQQQVEALLQEQVGSTSRKGYARRRNRRALTDSQLEEALKDYAPLTAESFPDLSAADYRNMIRSQNGKLSKGLEKWL